MLRSPFNGRSCYRGSHPPTGAAAAVQGTVMRLTSEERYGKGTESERESGVPEVVLQRWADGDQASQILVEISFAKTWDGQTSTRSAGVPRHALSYRPHRDFTGHQFVTNGNPTTPHALGVASSSRPVAQLPPCPSWWSRQWSGLACCDSMDWSSALPKIPSPPQLA